jgi:chitin synthase
LKKWIDHENELWETGSAETKGTSLTSSTTRRTTTPPIMGYGAPAMANSGYMTPVPNYATSVAGINQLPNNNALYNDNASFRYSASQQNLAGRASSVALGPSSIMLPHVSPPSVYSEPSVYGGYPPVNMMDPSTYQQLPTDEEIRREVIRITSTADLMTMTKKQVREQLSRHFGVNMSYRKDFINYCIEEALNL